MDPDAETKEDKRKMPKVTKVYYRSYTENSSYYKVCINAICFRDYVDETFCIYI